MQAKIDPRGFFDRYNYWIVDEAQNFPELFSYLPEFADQQHKKFILSGSQNFLLSEKISQSLAGRVAIFELLPLSYLEYATSPNKKYTLWDLLYHGWYPRPYHEHLDFVIAEIMKLYLAKAKTAPIYFWRDHGGLEVDIILERMEGLLAIEAKSGMTIHSDFLNSLKNWKKISDVNSDSWLIYAGGKKMELNDIKILPWNEFQELV